MPDKIKIGLLEDHAVAAEGFKSQLEKNPQLCVCWKAKYYQEVERNIQQEEVDILILDVGAKAAPQDIEPYPIFHAIQDLLERYPELKIVIITMYDRPAMVKALQRVGASGYILKDDHDSFAILDQILLRIWQEEEIYYSPEIEAKISTSSLHPELTPRQVEILSMMANNPSITTRELAESLYVSPSTIRNHLADAYLRLSVNRLSAAIAKARQLGLIPPSREEYPGLTNNR